MFGGQLISVSYLFDSVYVIVKAGTHLAVKFCTLLIEITSVGYGYAVCSFFEK